MRQARSEKWEALGTLSAGAAHELATPLTSIAIVSNEIQRELASQAVSDTIVQDVELIRSEVGRCRSILDRMSIDAGHIAAETLSEIETATLIDSMLDEFLGDRNRVNVEVADEAKHSVVRIPIQSVAQALRGILQNALDASPDSAVDLTVRTESNRLCIDICDRGVGMNAEVLRRADEPFFSTKEVGQGMGLGRFLARTVVERLGGSFETESAIGVGTRVQVRIPLQPNSEINCERTDRDTVNC